MPSAEAHEQHELRSNAHAQNPHPVRQPLTQRILAHRILSWATLSLAIAFYILSLLYAWHPELISRNKVFGGSPSRALQVLAILSMVANWLLAATISQSFDLTWGMLLARHDGLCLLSGLALQPGTGLDGHVEIVCRWHRGGLQPRAWSVFKIVSMTIIPILGIVILRDVEAVPLFFRKTSEPVARGYSIGSFNATLATLLQPLADGVFGTRFKDFLSDPDLVIDVSTNADRKGCSNAHRNDTKMTCRSRFFVPGGIEQFAPHLLVDNRFSGLDDVQPVLAKDLNGYHLEFQESESVVFDQQKDCIRQGYRLGAYQLCLKDVGAHRIATHLTPCPKSLAANMACMGNTTWPLEEGWGTTLSTYSRTADVTYNGLNGTILAHKFPNSTLTPVNIAAPELLQVFKVLFSPADPNSAYGTFLTRLEIVGNKPVEPLTIWQYFEGLAELSQKDNRVDRRAMIGLQSLLAIPIYHCQAKDFIELRQLLSAQVNNSAILETLGLDIVNLFPIVEPDTDIYPALMSYTLEVGHGSLLAYIVLAGVTLSLCLGTNMAASFTNVGGRFRHMGPFPLLTQLCDCKTTYGNGTSVLLKHFQDLEAGQRLSEVSLMQVKLAEKKAVVGQVGPELAANRIEN
ncbi:hypothetical protein BKA65DRAFT_108317 [Rhexocercosporidium sp. MPI-PUGE-AT-0058]|nr:hypothetical protein BKA65DRAFT_108317 [Rhexocercosporidium sp. MPI-PUGE-AT-0058]